MSSNQGLNENESTEIKVDNSKLKENYERLKKIGAQKIHEKTHIPKSECEDLVNGYFESMNKVQFTGFISILERDYSLDLSALKAEGLDFFQKNEKLLDEEKLGVFITPKKTKSYKGLYIFGVFLVFLAVIFQLSSQDSEVEPKIDSKKIKQVASKIVPKEQNTTKEPLVKNIKTEEKETELKKEIKKEEVVKQEELNISNRLKIIPNSKLWVGYINLNSEKKYQKILNKDETLELDPTIDWLLSLGHGDVTIDENSKLKKFKEPKNIRFVYKNAKLEKVTYKEFKELNKGKEW